MSAASIIAIILALVGYTVAFWKFISNMNSNVAVLATKIDERTTSLVAHLKKIDSTLDKLANADIRLSTLEALGLDHESRLRSLERE